jgi:P4 family phage/plasmid primase-like protien
MGTAADTAAAIPSTAPTPDLFHQAVEALWPNGEPALALTYESEAGGRAAVVDLRQVQDPTRDLWQFITWTTPTWIRDLVHAGALPLPYVEMAPGAAAAWRRKIQSGYKLPTGQVATQDAEVWDHNHPFIVVEIDYLLCQQGDNAQMKAAQRQAIATALQEGRFPFTVLIDSGGKSVHAVIRLADSVPAIMQAREPGGTHDRLREALWTALGNFDTGVYDLGGKYKLVRAPGALRDGTTPQTILAVNPQPVTYQSLLDWAHGQAFPEVAAEMAGRPPCKRPEMQPWRLREGYKLALRGPWAKGGRGSRWFQVAREIAASGNAGIRPDGSASFLWWFSTVAVQLLSGGWFWSQDQADQDTQKERRFTFTEAKQAKAEKDQYEQERGQIPEIKALAHASLERQQEMAVTLTPPDVKVSKGKKGGGGGDGEAKAEERNALIVSTLLTEHYPNRSLMKLSPQHGGEYMAYDGRRWVVCDVETLIGKCLRIYGFGLTERQAKDAVSHIASIVKWDGPFPEPRDAVVFTNGTLYFTDEEGRPEVCFMEDHFDMYDYVTTYIPRVYKPGKTCPKFLAWLERAHPDASVRAVLQEFVGTILVPDNRFNVFALNYGLGGNGKSTFLNIIEAMIGKENRGAISLAQLGDPFHIGYVYDKLLLYDDDVSRTVLKSNGGANCGDVLKQITGNATVSAQKKFGPIHDVLVRGSIFLNCNQKPHWATTPDAGFWRRLLIFPWEVTFIGEEQANYSKSLMGELDGVLCWALEGLKRLVARQGMNMDSKTTMLRGFTRSERMLQEVEDFQAEADPLKLFVQSYLVESQDKHSWYSLRGVFDAYKAYCHDNDIIHVPQFHTFSSRLANLRSSCKFLSVKRPRASEKNERPLDLPVITDPTGRYNYSYCGFTCTHPAFKRPVVLTQPNSMAPQAVIFAQPPPLRIVGAPA